MYALRRMMVYNLSDTFFDHEPTTYLISFLILPSKLVRARAASTFFCSKRDLFSVIKRNGV